MSERGGILFSFSLLPLWSIRLISQLIDYSYTVGLLGWVISSSQGLYTQDNTNTEKRTYTPNIHALSAIRTHDPGLRASEDSTCLRPLDYRDRQRILYVSSKPIGPNTDASDLYPEGNRFSFRPPSVLSFVWFSAIHPCRCQDTA
jgi:hypothetical protein